VGEGETIEILPDLKVNIQMEINTVIKERQNLIKENDKSSAITRTTMAEDTEMKSDDQILIESGTTTDLHEHEISDSR
jgi:hypothetical protein